MSTENVVTGFPQLYETIVTDPSSGLALQFIIVPARSLEENSILDDSIQAMKRLGVEPHCTIKESRLANALTAEGALRMADSSEMPNKPLQRRP